MNHVGAVVYAEVETTAGGRPSQTPYWPSLPVELRCPGGETKASGDRGLAVEHGAVHLGCQGRVAIGDL